MDQLFTSFGFHVRLRASKMVYVRFSEILRSPIGFTRHIGVQEFRVVVR